MKTRKRVVIYTSWQDRQHKHVWRWLVVVASGIAMWLQDGLAALAATLPGKGHLEDVRWVWRDQRFNLESLVVVGVLVIVGLICWLNVDRAKRWRI